MLTTNFIALSVSDGELEKMAGNTFVSRIGRGSSIAARM